MVSISNKTDSTPPGIVFLVKGVLENDQNFWAYLSVPPEKVEEYLKAQQEESFSLDSYGDILLYQEGETEPDQETKDEMEELFFVKHDLVDRFKEEVEKLHEQKSFRQKVRPNKESD